MRKMMYTFFVGCFFMGSLLVACKSENAAVKSTQPLSEVIPQTAKIFIVIDKSDYELRVFTSDTLVKSYNVVFGGNPVDDKFKEGDKRTPEGVFGVRDAYPHQQWSKFIWIDYPNAQSWKKFNTRKRQGLIREGETIGGEIGIHGVPKGKDYLIDNQQNWTLGCIAMRNADINELYPFINKQTQITIQK